MVGPPCPEAAKPPRKTMLDTGIEFRVYQTPARWCGMKVKQNRFWNPSWQAEHGGSKVVRAFTRRGAMRKARRALLRR